MKTDSIIISELDRSLLERDYGLEQVWFWEPELQFEDLHSGFREMTLTMKDDDSDFISAFEAIGLKYEEVVKEWAENDGVEGAHEVMGAKLFEKIIAAVNEIKYEEVKKKVMKSFFGKEAERLWRLL